MKFKYTICSAVSFLRHYHSKCRMNQKEDIRLWLLRHRHATLLLFKASTGRDWK
ncbi:hypothetical protein EVA_14543 [gut metagenome]|uniref:Uncharacterized protein n=1 Tax=gut metagenome TaxID=749906 RepID=J9FQW3_9ZZZZ